VYEGFEPFSNQYRREGRTFTPPVFAYGRKYGNSVTGGYVYRGDKQSSFNGVYLCGDYTSKRIFGVRQEKGVLKDVRQVATVPGLDERSYLVANNHETAGMCLQWFRGILGGPDNEVDYDTLAALAASSPPGAGGVIFTPWLKGERSPVADRSARAGFHDMGLATTRADMIRAVMEGVAYNNVWLLAAVEKFIGGRLDDIRIIGGGAQSDLWCQIHADTMDRTIEQVADPLYCGLRGAALSAGMALGRVKADELRDLVAVQRRFHPDPSNRATYDRLYGEFPGLYSMQRKFFRRLNR
jgi:xylulokinase